MLQALVGAAAQEEGSTEIEEKGTTLWQRRWVSDAATRRSGPEFIKELTESGGEHDSSIEQIYISIR